MNLLLYILPIFILTLNITNAFATDIEHSIEHDGYKRNYIVHTPPSFTKEKQLPIVMVFHGGGGNAKAIIRQTSMNETANKYNFIAIYPEGIESLIGNFHTWNTGECCGRAQKDNIDDVGFISKLIEQLYQDYNIDKKRVYATGHSNGAMMSYKLACEIPYKITAIAPNSGIMDINNCNESRSVPILHIHGTQDKCANYYGAKNCGSCFSNFSRKKLNQSKPNMQKTKKCYPVPETNFKWAQNNHCEKNKKITFQKGNVTCQTWQGCKAPVTLCSIKGAGHTWPGGNYGAKMCQKRPNGKLCKKYKNIVGSINYDINANEFMWNFFKDYSL